MRAKIPLILTLIVSLLFATQARSVVLPVEMKQGGMCAGMECMSGCCANMACCKMMEQRKAPKTPISPPQSTHVQLAALGLRAYTILLTPPAPRRLFVIPDEAGVAHTLSPLAAGCIRLL
ncbi:MAG: hypothetical protein ABI318_08780 [Chthoniobacteraceae bacterium]